MRRNDKAKLLGGPRDGDPRETDMAAPVKLSGLFGPPPPTTAGHPTSKGYQPEWASRGQ